ncbi:MAG: class I SAM-dependent methyltransferase [Humidesulfovibrio sp.]|uniref:16S rRNA (guanine(527)-N(7))-methyltransferase RsmG n=1 Tax=Humidesulfovibrio sp. TaxID=2910988 RepID=UPI0027355D76|nr:RsmG family class I SAM-dependent methyltransferase [Humidesulfovibrio sp.]MDP2847033.1 class I SAM-dependent methyltransferase [Humidesulfovibrio sp.]
MIKKRSEPKPYAPAPGEVSGEARRSGFKLLPPQAEALSGYLTLLLKWNRSMNLVGRSDWPGVFRDLTADSLHLAEFLKGLALPEAPLCLDLGAGAGLPGIPLRVLWPDGDYVLVELREKRAIFLSQAVGTVKLPRTFVVHGRAEVVLAELPKLKLSQPRERADVVLSRAFMPWPQLLPLAAELLAEGGRLVVLANEPPPVGQGDELGVGFRLESSLEYPADGRSRYFWSLVLASA